jgi:hypothetical protein
MTPSPYFEGKFINRTVSEGKVIRLDLSTPGKPGLLPPKILEKKQIRQNYVINPNPEKRVAPHGDFPDDYYDPSKTDLTKGFEAPARLPIKLEALLINPETLSWRDTNWAAQWNHAKRSSLDRQVESKPELGSLLGRANIFNLGAGPIWENIDVSDMPFYSNGGNLDKINWVNSPSQHPLNWSKYFSTGATTKLDISGMVTETFP